jgi:hypothetical protein
MTLEKTREMVMKRFIGLLSVWMLIAVGCGKAESKLVGTWKSPTVAGFSAEFKKDHTGITVTPMPGHAGAASTETAKTPFKWSISKDGKVTITEDKNTYTGKIVEKKLEIDFGGDKAVLEKAK